MSMPTDERPAGNSTSAGLLTQKEYARRRGWSKQYVHQLVKQGRIPFVNGRIDPAAADAALAGSRDPSRGPRVRVSAGNSATSGPRSDLGAHPTPGGAEGTFVKARTVREHFRAMREKMEFEAATGELVRRRDVEDEAYAVGVMFREHMMRCAELIATKIAAHFKIEFHETRRLVTEGVTLALVQLVDQIRGNEWGFDSGLVEATGESKQVSSADKNQQRDTN